MVIKSSDTVSESKGAGGSDSTTGDDTEVDSDEIEAPLINLQERLSSNTSNYDPLPL